MSSKVLVLQNTLLRIGIMQLNCFFAMQAIAIAERYHVFFGVLVLFLGLVISVVLEGRVANDA